MRSTDSVREQWRAADCPIVKLEAVHASAWVGALAREVYIGAAGEGDDAHVLGSVYHA